jgi:hypothetical protein
MTYITAGKDGQTIELPQFEGSITGYTNTVYSDRLFQWDHEKYNRLCQKHFGDEGQVFYNRKSDKIEAFLRDYTEDESLILTLVKEQKNVSSGYPLWLFGYVKKGDKLIWDSGFDFDFCTFVGKSKTQEFDMYVVKLESGILEGSENTFPGRELIARNPKTEQEIKEKYGVGQKQNRKNKGNR